MANIHTPSAHALVKCLAHAVTAGANSAYVDCQGYTRALIIQTVTTAAASTLAASQLQECDTSGGSYANVASGGAFAAVVASTTNQVQVMDVDLTKHKRYLELTIGAITGTVGVDVHVLLFNGEGLPVTQDNTVISA